MMWRTFKFASGRGGHTRNSGAGQDGGAAAVGRRPARADLYSVEPLGPGGPLQLDPLIHVFGGCELLPSRTIAL